MGKFVQLLIATASAATVNPGSDMDQRFLKWIAEHGRNYHSLSEYTYRYEQFIMNHDSIDRINKKENATMTAGHNKFSDWSKEEKTRYARMGRSSKPKLDKTEPVLLDTSDLPTEVNWVTAGAVGPVRD